MTTVHCIPSLLIDRSYVAVCWWALASISVGRKVFPWKFFLFDSGRWRWTCLSPAGLRRSIELAERYFPRRPNCLTKALAARALLSLTGRESRLWFGAGRPGRGVFEAHAWLECEGLVVTGRESLERFVPLCYFDEFGRLHETGKKFPGA